jgi:hypothetical protein
LRRSHIRLFSCIAVVLLLAVLATTAMADGWRRPSKFRYTRELFTGSFPVINDTVELLIVKRNVIGDRISVDESKIFVPAGKKVRFHVTSLDANYVVKIKDSGSSDPLLEVAVSGGGQAEDTLRRGLGLKEVRDLLVAKDGKYIVGGTWQVVPEG